MDPNFFFYFKMFPEPGSRPSPDPTSPSTSILGVHSPPAFNLKFPFSISVFSCPLRATEFTRAMTHATPHQISMKPLLLGTRCIFYKWRAKNQLHASSGSKEAPLSREVSQTHAGHHMTEAWAAGHTLPITPIHTQAHTLTHLLSFQSQPALYYGAHLHGVDLWRLV